MDGKYKQHILVKIIKRVTYNGLLCSLVISTSQCTLSKVELSAEPNLRVGPEAISCIQDELPNELQQMVQKRERIFFVEPDAKNIQAFDVVQAVIEDTSLDFLSIPNLSPSKMYALFAQVLRSEGSGDEYMAYWRPIIRTLDANHEIIIPTEFSAQYTKWSPDDKCLVTFSYQNQKWEIGLYHLASGQYETWQLPTGIEITPEGLSPDGRWLVGWCGEKSWLCILKVNGELVYQSPGAYSFLGWSPDSKYLLIGEETWKVSFLDASSGWVKKPLIDETNCQLNCQAFQHFSLSSWSSDHTKLVGQISQPGYHPVVVIEFPSGDYYLLGPALRYPVWSPDSTELAVTKLDEAYLQPAGLYTIRYDGTNLKLIKETESYEQIRALFWTSGD